METADGIVRRKLNFSERSFACKSFYVDIRSVSVRNKVLEYIHQLGGSVETFLSKDIHVFVTDTKYNKRVRDLNNSVQDGGSYPDSPSPGASCLPLSRGRALLLKARRNGSENSSAMDRGLSSNVMIQKASDLGLKIEHVHTFLKKCKNLCGSVKLNKSKSDTLKDIVPLKWDNDVFIVKIEDDSNLYRPLHKQFDKLPIVYVDNGGGSPFDGPMVLEKTESVKGFKNSKSSKFYNAKGGYCEMCDFWFKSTLKEHLLCEKHSAFVNDESNFTGVERIVNKLPNFNNFFAKFCLPKPITDLLYSRDCFHDIKPCQASNNTNNHEDVNNNVNEIAMEKIEDFCETEEQPMDKEVSMEDNGEDFTSSDTIIYDYQDQVKGDNSNFHQEPVQNDCITVSNVPTASDMFSDNSVQDSQTDVLKNMISNWTLQDDKLSNSADVMSCSKPNNSENIYPRVIPGLPQPTGVEPTQSESEPDMCMSFSTPKAEDRSLLGDIMSSLKKLEGTVVNKPENKNDIDNTMMSKKRKHENVDEDCFYFSKKTDDTKLKIKLCKVTPVRQKTNLKMFWKVRKTGDCRLVFSTGKSRKPLIESSNDNSEIHDNNPSRKRQKTSAL